MVPNGADEASSRVGCKRAARNERVRRRTAARRRRGQLSVLCNLRIRRWSAATFTLGLGRALTLSLLNSA